MQAAAEAFVGTHDFSALRASGSSAKTSVRTVLAITVAGETRGEIAIDVRGEGFLRHMVRNLAGTLVEVAFGRHAECRHHPWGAHATSAGRALTAPMPCTTD